MPHSRKWSFFSGIYVTESYLMKIPQEKNRILEGSRKVMYAKDEDGQFSTHLYGSKVEEFATEVAVREYELLKQEALNNMRHGRSSPIEYYMYAHRMDLATLSKSVGFCPLRVKRHLKMKHFKKLNDKILMRYAQAFGIELVQLKKDINEFI